MSVSEPFIRRPIATSLLGIALMIGGSVALLMSFEDIRERIEPRPAADLARRLFPWYPGRLRPSFPPEWLEPLRQPARA